MRARYWNNTLLFERACIEGTRLKPDIRRNAKRNGRKKKKEKKRKKKEEKKESDECEFKQKPAAEQNCRIYEILLSY